MVTQSNYLVVPPNSGEPLPSIGVSSHRPFSVLGDSSSVATSHNRNIVEGRRKEQKVVHGQGDSYRRVTTIGMLPDNVLLEIFCFYRKEDNDDPTYPIWKWQFLVHICRRWRQVVFGSPHRLDLRLQCTARTPARKNLDIWPALPIFVDYQYSCGRIRSHNIFPALELVDRVCDVWLQVQTGEFLEKFAMVMQKPFPVLRSLRIVKVKQKDEIVSVFPAEFLGGSAPRLQYLFLYGIPFPTLPTLLLSATDLAHLELRIIPSTGYISPEEMVVGLVALPRLRTFIIEFQSATPRPDLTHPPPVTRTILPALTSFQFKGASEYLEDLVARIDGPQLNGIHIYYLNQLVDFHVVQLSRFIDRSVGPKLALFKHAHVTFDSNQVSFNTYHHENDPDTNMPYATTTISCKEIDYQVSHMAQVLGHFSAALSHVVHLDLEVDPDENRELDGLDGIEWLLRQFLSVKTLYVTRELAGYIALALEDITAEMVAEVLPSLDLICLAGQPESSIGKFIAARQLSGLPVTVVSSEEELDERIESYVSK